jgi:hypothetical protein
MSESPLATLRAAIKAIESNDLDAIMSLIDETCTISREKDIVVADGHEAIRDFYARAFENYSKLKVEIREHFEVGTVLMVHEVNTTEGGDSPVHSTWAYQVRDGKIMLMHMFDPSSEMNAMLSDVGNK